MISLLAGAFGFKKDQIPDLANWIALKVDRQYSRKGLIVWGHCHGLDLLCTLMRQGFVPLTFGKPGDRGQFNILAKEAACAYSRTLDHNFGKSGNNRKLSVVGWRNGTSSTVTLFLTTEMHDLSYDLVAANPADLQLYQANLSLSQRLRLGFKHFCGDPDPALDEENDDEADHHSDEEESLKGHIGTLSKQVMPVTMVQLCAMWWFLRTFCLTSSTTSHLIKLFARTIDVEHPMRKDFEVVLRYTGNLNLLPGADTDGRESDGGGSDGGDEEPVSDVVSSVHLSNDHKSMFESILEHLTVE